MTQEEVEKLKVGEHIEVKVGGKWRLARVEQTFDGGAWCRRPGRTRAGCTRPRLFANRHNARATEYSPESANVFADWLDDAGHHEAAALLREAFPLGDRTP